MKKIICWLIGHSWKNKIVGIDGSLVTMNSTCLQCNESVRRVRTKSPAWQ